MKKRINKKIIVVAAVVLALVVSIGSALAFLSTKDVKENVFTLGNIQIELWEKFDTNNDGRISGTDTNGNIIDLSNSEDEIYGPEKKSLVGENILPGVNTQKAPWIKNTGDRDAYVYMDVKVPYLNASELEGLFDEDIIGDGKPLFTFKHYENGELVEGFNTNDWVLIGEYYPAGMAGEEVYNKTITYNVVEYVFAYKNDATGDKLPAGENNDTPTLFDAVSFGGWISEETFPVLQAYFKDNRSFASMWNKAMRDYGSNTYGLITSIVSGIFGTGEEIDMTFADIVINGYAIQAELDKSANVESAVDAWGIYAKQTDWKIQTGDEIMVLKRTKSVVASKNIEYHYYDGAEGFDMPMFTALESTGGNYRWLANYTDITTGSEDEYPFYLFQGEHVSARNDCGEGTTPVPEYFVSSIAQVENGEAHQKTAKNYFAYKNEPTKLYNEDGSYAGEFNIDGTFEYNNYNYPIDSETGIIYRMRKVSYFEPCFDYSLDYICFEHLDGEKVEWGMSSSANKFYPVVDHVPDKSVGGVSTIYFPDFNEYDLAHEADYWTFGSDTRSQGSQYYPSMWWTASYMKVHSASEDRDPLEGEMYEMKFYPTPDLMCTQNYDRRGVADEEVFAPEFDNVVSYEMPEVLASKFPKLSTYDRWICDQDETYTLEPGERVIITPERFDPETRLLTFHPDIDGKISIILLDATNLGVNTLRASSYGQIAVFDESDIIKEDGTYRAAAFYVRPYPQNGGMMVNGE